MQNNNPDFEQSERWRKDPKNWVGGLFYYNLEDKRMLPRKRIREFGWTVNFANPKSVLLFVGMLAIAGAVIYFISP